MTNPNIIPCLAAALDYLARGWSVVPLCPPDHDNVGPAHEERCESPGKAPIVSWTDYQRRRATERELRVYWNRCPKANVGVILGKVSSLIGIDVDGHVGETLLRDLFPGVLPTMEFTTPGGGRRLLYDMPHDWTIPTKAFKLADGELKILGEGSLTVMPPSTHQNGGTY